MKKIFTILIFILLLITACTSKNYTPTDLQANKEIEIKSKYETLGFRKYIKNPNNVPTYFIDSRVLMTPIEFSQKSPKNTYDLCADNEKSAMNLFKSYLEHKNYDPHILNNPNASEKQKEERKKLGYGGYYLVDNWKAETHYHFVISYLDEPFWEHVILQDCNYFIPTNKRNNKEATSLSWSTNIGTLGKSFRNQNDFLEFIKYFHGSYGGPADNKLHNVFLSEDSNSIITAAKIVLSNWKDWGQPTLYIYYNTTYTLNKNDGEINISYEKIGTSDGSIDEKLLK